MLPDRERLRRRASQPRLVALYRALTRLRSVQTVMNTGAHPDDEHSAMLAVMRHQLGMRVVIACSTRGEGGQNVLGPERGGALGLLRTREMEEAARVLDADIAWLGFGPDDPVHDFGFSKSGEDTLNRWGEARVIERMVRAYRRFRPDIVIPTFLDVPGQHGHHRAMTLAARKALAAAADPKAYPEHRAEGLAPWQVSKFYLPAWSGGGDTYDDEVPPPAATVQVVAEGMDPATGMSLDRLGETSRAFHASQAMGRWHGTMETRFPLHLLGGPAENHIGSGLPQKLADLSRHAGLAEADAAIDAALAAFPDGPKTVAALAKARRALDAARQEFDADGLARHGHRIARKRAELDAALALAAGLEVSAALSTPRLAPGQTADLIVEIVPGMASAITVTPHVGADFIAGATAPATSDRLVLPLQARPDARPATPFAETWLSLGGNGQAFVAVSAEIGGVRVEVVRDGEELAQVAPAHRVALDPEAIILPLPARAARQIALKADIEPDRVTLDNGPGLAVARDGASFTLQPGPDLIEGRQSLALHVDGAPAHAVAPIAYDHIGRVDFVRPLTLNVLALRLALPPVRVGYIGGGADRVGLWLARMGFDVTPLDAEALAGDLSVCDTIVVGIFAYGTRPDLVAANERIKAWTAAGGHLVTLYHRPSDGWRPDSTPPRPITIGSPSLRWRVTDPAAPVTLLAPDHPLLAGPNRITQADFAGWTKERGLYFASAWDGAYQPLLAMNDAGEAPLTGSLLSAPIGQGRHTHTSLVLHHQLDHLVPGAFRLMANLVQGVR